MGLVFAKIEGTGDSTVQVLVEAERDEAELKRLKEWALLKLSSYTCNCFVEELCPRYEENPGWFLLDDSNLSPGPLLTEVLLAPLSDL